MLLFRDEKVIVIFLRIYSFLQKDLANNLSIPITPIEQILQQQFVVFTAKHTGYPPVKHKCYNKHYILALHTCKYFNKSVKHKCLSPLVVHKWRQTRKITRYCLTKLGAVFYTALVNLREESRKNWRLLARLP